MSINEELNLFVEVDKRLIYNFSEKINEQKIVEIATKIEKMLLENGANHTKIKSVYEITVEMLQNILSYSYDSAEIEENRLEANCSFRVAYNSEEDIYCLNSFNLIESSQESLIREKLDALKGLTDKELRQLARQKMRSREDNHNRGAGLGFITIAKKATKELSYEFKDIVGEVKRFEFLVKV
jgi:hypothetical protein